MIPQFSSVMSLERPTRRNERLKIVSETGVDVDLHMRRTKLIIQNLYDNVYLATFGKKIYY